MSLPAALPRARSKILRFLGINFQTLREFAPSRKTALYLSLAASPIAIYAYDRRVADTIRSEFIDRVRQLADAPLPGPDDGEDALLEFPRKIWIMSTSVPDDIQVDRANRWFKTYIQPVLYAAGYDYSFLNGTVPGSLGRRIRDRIRMERIASSTPQPAVIPGEAGYLQSLDRRRHAKAMGLTVLVGRNTLKEYLWGLKQGWLVDFDAVQEDRGEEGRLQDFKEELDKDGVFEIPAQSSSLSLNEQEDLYEAIAESPPLPEPPSILPPRSAFSFLSKSQPPISPTLPHPSLDSQTLLNERSYNIPAVSEIPSQPPFLFLPFDHPLGRLRHWPVKMVKYLFFERYRVRQGCETALAIIQATHPKSNTRPHMGPDDASDILKGMRTIQTPQVMNDVQLDDERATISEVVTENRKKLRSEWQGEDLPESGSKDIDSDYYSEYHYRSSFTDMPVNIEAQRKNFYEELPAKLKVARELENRDRLPTKEEQKYPPPTEADLRKDRLNKEKKWRNDFQGWLMTRVGSKVTWDSRFESFKILDLDLASDSIARNGFVNDRRENETEFSR